jgi:hypothetical protein
MVATKVFLTTLAILTIINVAVSFLPIGYGATFLVLDETFFVNLVATFATMVALMIVGSVTVMGSGLDTGVYKYVLGFVVMLGLFFSITIDPWILGNQLFPPAGLTLGVGLISNILSDLWAIGMVDLFSTAAITLFSVISLIAIGSGIMMMVSGE